MARVGALRVRNIKIFCYLKTPNLSSCKQIREAMSAFVEKENIKLGPQGSTLFVTKSLLGVRNNRELLGKLWARLSNGPQ